jgi:hypothetical protein
MGSRPMTRQHVLTLPDDGITGPVAAGISARGTRPVALTRAWRRPAATRILAQGGTPSLTSARLRVSGTAALVLAARSRPGVVTAS